VAHEQEANLRPGDEPAHLEGDGQALRIKKGRSELAASPKSGLCSLGRKPRIRAIAGLVIGTYLHPRCWVASLGPFLVLFDRLPEKVEDKLLMPIPRNPALRTNTRSSPSKGNTLAVAREFTLHRKR
jgi:hypothetical protein